MGLRLLSSVGVLVMAWQFISPVIGCPAPFIDTGSGCYYIEMDPENAVVYHRGAVRQCQNMGGHIVDITTEAKYDDIVNLLKTRYTWKAGWPDSLRIGATYDINRGAWMWTGKGDGEGVPVSDGFHKWDEAEGEPNKMDRQPTAALRIKDTRWGKAFFWHSLPTAIANTGFICEADIL